MSISTNYSVSYTDLTAGSMSIKGQGQTAQKQESEDTSAKKTDMDTVSLSTSSYKIGNNSVSQSEFEKYDANGDGQISQDELAAYEADQSSSTEETSDTDDTAAASSSAIEQLTMSGTSTEEALLQGLSSVDMYA